jgi:GT2 family glycosyltransferase
MCRISVIIITKELNSIINETLKALLSQDFNDYEIIIVCQKNSLKKLPMTNVPMKIIEKPGTTRGMARNIGVMNSSGDVVAFIDDDCVPNDKGWLQRGLKTLNKSKRIGVVGGRVRVHEELPKFSKIALNVVSVPFINGWSVTFSSFKTKREVSYVPTCNAFFKKDILKKVGGFMDINYCEDVEVCSRIKKFGYKIIYNPKVEIRHRWNIRHWGNFIKLFFNYGKGRGFVTIKYPYIGKINVSPLVAFIGTLILTLLIILEHGLFFPILLSFMGFTVFCSLYTYHKFKDREYLIYTIPLIVSMYLSYIAGYVTGLFMGLVRLKRK